MRLLRRRAPLVSVVVPAYDVEAWLPECLESLVAQTHDAWEAVVVDDGSPDRSGEIAEEWARASRGSGWCTRPTAASAPPATRG